jgi:hypothetical protein
MLVAALAVLFWNGQVGEGEPGIRAFMHAMPPYGWLTWLAMTDDGHHGLPQTRHRLKIGGVGMRGSTARADGDEQRECCSTANSRPAAKPPGMLDKMIHGWNALGDSRSTQMPA